MRPLVSVVIPIYGADERFGVQLAALSNQDAEFPWELVIADNGNNDRLTELVEPHLAHLPATQIVDARDRKGPSHARNVGVRASAGSLLVFVDADDEVQTGYVRAMARGMAMHAMVVSRVDHDRLNRHWGGYVHRIWQIDDIGNYGRHPVASGGTLGMHRKLFDEIGGFDEDMMGAEDIDICVRASMAGAPAEFVPDAVVAYRARDTLTGHWRQKRSWGRNDIALFARHHMNRGDDAVRPPRKVSTHLPLYVKRIMRRVYSTRSRAELGRLLGEIAHRLGRFEARAAAKRKGEDVSEYWW
jgi:glycosyltransferase involved in cell wall biosynthesis